jgi:hypothetical protein
MIFVIIVNGFLEDFGRGLGLGIKTLNFIFDGTITGVRCHQDADFPC